MTAAETPFAVADTGQTLRARLLLRQAVAVSEPISPATAKTELRRTIRAARRNRLTSDRSVHHDDDTRIADRVMDLPEIRSACEQGQPIACYVSRSEEPPTTRLRDRLLDAGAILLLPRIHGDDLQWIQVTPQTTWSVNRWGIEEPEGNPFLDSPALWIVPALAIDADGHRLGQGGGFYDRALARFPNGQTVIAIVFDDELIDHVPHEEHDQVVDIAVTPERVARLPRS